MDALDRVRLMASDVMVSKDGVERARTVLESTLEDQPRPRRVLALRIGIGLAAAAAATAIALVVALWQPNASTPVAITPHPTPERTVEPTPTPTVTAPPSSPPLTVAGVVEEAAALAPLTVGSEISSGRYLRVDTTTETLARYVPGGDIYQTPRASAVAGWITQNSYTTYIPADRSAEWVRVFSPDHPLVRGFGPDAEALYASWLARTWHEGFTLRTLGGVPGSETEPGEILMGSDAYFAQVPRETDSLYNWYASRSDGDPALTFLLVVQDLEMNAAPADLRAAMFRALGRIPGVVISSVEGAVVTLAIEWQFQGDFRQNSVSVDTATGFITASTSTRGSGGTLIPDSVPDHRITTTFSAVDVAP